jgi:hypothetical protein
MACGRSGKLAGDCVGIGKSVADVTVDDNIKEFNSMLRHTEANQKAFFMGEYPGEGGTLVGGNTGLGNTASALLSTLAELDNDPMFVIPEGGDDKLATLAPTDLNNADTLRAKLAEMGVPIAAAGVLKPIRRGGNEYAINLKGTGLIRLIPNDKGDGLFIQTGASGATVPLSRNSFREALVQARQDFITDATRRADDLKNTAVMAGRMSTELELRQALRLLPQAEKAQVLKALSSSKKQLKNIYAVADGKPFSEAQVADELAQVNIWQLESSDKPVATPKTVTKAKAALAGQIRAMPQLSDTAKEILVASIQVGKDEPKGLFLHTGDDALEFSYADGELVLNGTDGAVPATPGAILTEVSRSYREYEEELEMDEWEQEAEDWRREQEAEEHGDDDYDEEDYEDEDYYPDGSVNWDALGARIGTLKPEVIATFELRHLSGEDPVQLLDELQADPANRKDDAIEWYLMLGGDKRRE